MLKRVLAAVLGVGLVATVAFWASEMYRKLDKAEKQVQQLTEERMQSITTTWTSGGTTHSVTTTQQSGEAWAQTLVRHDEAVKEAKRLYPPDA